MAARISLTRYLEAYAQARSRTQDFRGKSTPEKRARRRRIIRRKVALMLRGACA